MSVGLRKPFRSTWVDSIPSEWDQVKLGRVARIFAGGTPDKKRDDFWQNGNIPWVNSGAVNQWLILEASDFITEAGYNGSSAAWVPKGALVMALAGQGKTKGMVAQMGIDATCNQSMAAIVLNSGNPRYFLYWLTSNYRNIRGMASDDLRDGLNLAVVNQIPCPVPPLLEQAAIVSFLDVETARIDSLIHEKSKLIKILREQRVMVAESVVAPASDGREAKLGYFVNLLPGFAFPSKSFSSNESDVHLLRGVNVAPGIIRWEDNVYWPADQCGELDRFRLAAGDVVFGMDRPWISSGARVALIDPLSAGSLLLQRVCRIRGEKEILNRYVYYVLASDKFRQSIEFELSGVSVPHISPEQITRFKIPVLTVSEQRRRCNEADEEISRIDDLIDIAERMIYALKELRLTTITDAVLGRIDVRPTVQNRQELEAA